MNELEEARAYYRALSEPIRQAQRDDERIGRLRDAMVQLASAYREADVSQDFIQARRIEALTLAVVDYFLEATNIPSGPLIGLGVKLASIDEGTVHPSLMPVRNGGQPKKASAEIVIRAWAAAAVQLLMDEGCNRDDAGRHVAKALEARGHWKRAPGKGAQWKQVLRWRATASEAGANSSEQKLYRQCLAAIKNAWNGAKVKGAHDCKSFVSTSIKNLPLEEAPIRTSLS